jgi:hypothetical protein
VASSVERKLAFGGRPAWGPGAARREGAGRMPSPSPAAVGASTEQSALGSRPLGGIPPRLPSRGVRALHLPRTGALLLFRSTTSPASR